MTQANGGGCRHHAQVRRIVALVLGHLMIAYFLVGVFFTAWLMIGAGAYAEFLRFMLPYLGILTVFFERFPAPCRSSQIRGSIAGSWTRSVCGGVRLRLREREMAGQRWRHRSHVHNLVVVLRTVLARIRTWQHLILTSRSSPSRNQAGTSASRTWVNLNRYPRYSFPVLTEVQRASPNDVLPNFVPQAEPLIYDRVTDPHAPPGFRGS